MNGKVAKMLRKMRREDHKSKKHFKSLTHVQRGMVRTAHENNVKLIYIDFLETLFPIKVKKKSEPRKLETGWKIEKGQDLPTEHGLGLEEEMTKAIIADVEATRNA